MIRSIREHVATHNWFAVAVDLAIVIAGVFMGIQVSNWNEARIESDKAQDYRARLGEEIAYNRLQYGAQLAYYRRVRSHALGALRWIRNRKGSGGSEFLVDAYQATQLDIWPAKRFIYDEMMSAGMAASIGGPGVQRLASDFYQGIDAIALTLNKEPPYRHVVRKAMPYAIQLRVRQRCADQLVTAEGRVIGIALPATCDPGFSPESIDEGVSRLRAEPRLEAELNGHLAALDQKINLLKLTIGQANEALAGLRGR